MNISIKLINPQKVTKKYGYFTGAGKNHHKMPQIPIYILLYQDG